MNKKQRRLFLEKASAAYEKLKSDKLAWQEELDEREQWNVTLSDGLEKLSTKKTRSVD